MYDPMKLQITEIDRAHVSVAGIFDNYSLPLERKSPIDDAPTNPHVAAYHHSRLWTDVGQLLTQR